MSDEKLLPQILHAWVEVFMRRSFSDFKRFMDQAGLSPSQAGTLMHLYHCKELGISDVAKHSGLTVPAASQLVDRLVQQGWLERAEHPNDRRFKQVTLSPTGRSLVEAGIEARRKWMEELTEKFTPEQQQVIVEALTLLTEAARQPEPAPAL